MAFVDTDLVRALDGPKASPDEIVARALDGLEAGSTKVLADERTRLVRQGLTAARPSYLPQAPDRRTDRQHGATHDSCRLAAAPRDRAPRATRVAVARLLGREHGDLPGLARRHDAVLGASVRLRAAFPAASAADMSWVLNAYTVVYAAMLIPAGGLADTHGRKRVFLFGVTIFIAASALCGLAGSAGWLVTARALQAVGAALLTPASLSIVLAAFPQSRRAVTVSLWGAVGGFAAAVGPSLGSFIVQTVGWPWAFFINLPIGAVSLWWGASLLRESERGGTRRRVDAVGMVLLVVAVAAIALAIVESDSPSWSRGQLAATAAPARSRWWRSSSGRAACASRWSTSGCSATARTAR
jgi:hypothetical protein